MASSRASQEKRCCAGTFGVDFTRFLDGGCMALFSILLSCVYLFMFGETLRMIGRTEFAHKDYVKRFLNRLFPFRNNFEFNLTHTLLFTLCLLLLSFRGEFPSPSHGNHAHGKNQ